MMNHSQKGIFTPIRNEPLTGRNANIQPSMFKRKQIFQKATTERFQTPFSGYSFTGSSVTDNSLLARSQVSQFNQQHVIRLIKEELQKNGLNTLGETSQQSLKNKNELNILRIQIRSIKESYHELNKSFKRRFEEQNQTINELRKQFTVQNKDQSVYKEEISGQLVEKIKQVEQDIAIKMRMVFGKMQQDLRKQLTNYANRQFVPISFLDDLDKQLNEIDDRISVMESQYESVKNNGNKQNVSVSKIEKDTSSIMNPNAELKLNKLERDLQYVKKVLDEKSQKIKELDELIVMGHQNQTRQIRQLKENISELTTSSKQNKKDNDHFRGIIEGKVQSYRKSIQERIETQMQILNKKIYEAKVSKMQNFPINNDSQLMKKTESTSILVQNNDMLTQSIKSQQTRDQSKLVTSELKQHKQSPGKKNKKITITYSTQNKYPDSSTIEQKTQGVTKVNSDEIKSQSGNNDKIQRVKQNQGQKQNKKEEVKKLYKVDKDGYLMDNQNKYILSPTNSMIRISQQQISSMEKVNLIKVQKWSQKVGDV